MFRSLAVLSMCALVSLTAEIAFAQRDAGAKARGDYSGTFWSGSTKQSHARDRARVLYNYGRAQPQVARTTVQENTQAIRMNVQSATKDFHAIKDANADNKEVVKLIDSILKHHDSAMEMCAMLEHKDETDADSKAVCDCCADMSKELHAAEKAAIQLGKMLKVKQLMDPAEHHGHAK